MKKLLIFFFSFLIGIELFSWVIKFVGWQEIKKAFLVFTGWQGMAILFLTLILLLVGVWKWKIILKSTGFNVSFSDLSGPYFAGFGIMYLFPMIFFGGETFRAFLLKKKNLLPLSKGMASVIIDRILDWTTNLIIIFFGAIFFLFKIGLPPKRLAIVFGGTFLFWLLGISFFYFKTLKRESMANFLLKFLGFKNRDSEPLEIEKEMFNFFKMKKKLFWEGISLAFFEEVIVFLKTWLLIFFLIGKNIGFLSTLSIDGFAYLAGMIPITAALGSHEVIQIFSFTSLGMGAATAVAFTLIFRGAELILALIGMVILYRLGIGLLRKTLF